VPSRQPRNKRIGKEKELWATATGALVRERALCLSRQQRDKRASVRKRALCLKTEARRTRALYMPDSVENEQG
jgi:hypothetical protein